jgi:hypothetical protein
MRKCSASTTCAVTMPTTSIMVEPAHRITLAFALQSVHSSFSIISALRSRRWEQLPWTHLANLVAHELSYQSAQVHSFLWVGGLMNQFWITAALVLGVVAAGAWYYEHAASPEAQVRRTVRDSLNDPESAVFRNLRQSERDLDVWCGEVNARNRIGGMVGFTRFVAWRHRKSSHQPLDKVHFDSGDAAFEGRWGYCY